MPDNERDVPRKRQTTSHTKDSDGLFSVGCFQWGASNGVLSIDCAQWIVPDGLKTFMNEREDDDAVLQD